MKHIVSFTFFTECLVRLNLPLVHTRSMTRRTLRKMLPRILSHEALRVPTQLTPQKSDTVHLILQITQLIHLRLQLRQLNYLGCCHKLPVRSRRLHDPAVLVKNDHPRLLVSPGTHHGDPPQHLVLRHRFAEQNRQLDDLLRWKVIFL